MGLRPPKLVKNDNDLGWAIDSSRDGYLSKTQIMRLIQGDVDTPTHRRCPGSC